MKKAFAIIVLFAVLISTAGKTAIWAWYKANTDIIAKTLCENKAKPKMHCNGKCYLAKQLKKAEGETKQTPALPQALKEVKETEGNIGEHNIAITPAITTVITAFIYQVPNSNPYSQVLLRPPIA